MKQKYYREKNAVITGAASGVGRMLSVKLAQMGTNLVISDINMERLRDLEVELKNYGVEVIAVKCDVTNRNDVNILVNDSLKKFDHIHLLFSNAGIYMGGPFEYFSFDDWERILQVNQWGMIHVVRGFIPKMLKQGFGHVIVTSSIAGSMGSGGIIPYCTSKFANTGFCEALYSEYKIKGIDVSVICPFPLKTNLIENYIFCIPPELLEGHSQESIEEGINAAKKVYWEEFTRKGSGVLGGVPLEKSVTRMLKKIRKKKLYVFERWYGRLFQYVRGAWPALYKLILKLSGKRHEALLEHAYEEFNKVVKKKGT